MKKLNVSSKEAIIGLRRKNKVRTKYGKLLFEMAKQGKLEIYGIKSLCGLLETDIRSVKKHLGFRIYEQGANENHVLSISKSDVEVIIETEKIFQRLLKLDHDQQKIAHYVFLHLVKSNGQ